MILPVQARKTTEVVEIQNNMPNGRIVLNSASGKQEFRFLAAQELKTTPSRIGNTYPVDAAIKLKV